MHIILGLLGTIVTILVLIRRLDDAGIDLTWLNPFSWFRRKQWSNKYQQNLVYSLEQPMDVAALLATSVAKIDGEISKEEKATLLKLFQSEFNRTEKEASDLLMSSIYIFGEGSDAIESPKKVMKKSLQNFTIDQASSVMTLLKTVQELDSVNATEKERFVQQVNSVFSKQFAQDDKW